MLIISEKEMFGFRDFTTFKLISAMNCSEFAMRSAIEKARSIEQSYVFYSEHCEFTANSMQFYTLKSGNLENQTFAFSRISD